MGLEKIYGRKPLDGNLEDFERKSVYDESRQASIDEYYAKVIESRRKSEQKEKLKQAVWSRIKNEYTSITNENSTDEIIQAAKDLMQKTYSYFDYGLKNIYFDGNQYENDRRTMAQHLKTLLEHKYNEAIEHIELPENEKISDRINQSIEKLEKFGYLSKSHKDSIAQEQGLESKELFSLIDTFQKKSAGALAISGLSNMREINSQISKRIDYLESKLAILMENREIDGNEERIVDLKKQISSIRSVWTEVVKSNTERILVFQANDKVKEQLCELIGNENLGERFEAEEQARLKAEQEAKEKAEEQDRLKAEQEARERAEEQARLKAEQEVREKTEEQARLKAEQAARERAEEQARLKAEQEAREKAEEQARLKAEQAARERAEEQARLKAEQEAKQKAEEQARLKAEQAARERAEEQARLKAEQAARDKKEQNIAQAQANDYEELMGNKKRNKVYGILGTLESERTKENEGKASADIWLHRYNKWYNVIDKIPENQKSKYMLIQEDVVKLVENMIKERAQQKEEHIQTQDVNER